MDTNPLTLRTWMRWSRARVLVAAGSVTLVVGVVRSAPVALRPVERSGGPAATMRMAQPLDESASEPAVVRGATPTSKPNFTPAHALAPAATQPKSPNSFQSSKAANTLNPSNAGWLDGPNPTPTPHSTSPTIGSDPASPSQEESGFLGQTWGNVKDFVVGGPAPTVPVAKPRPLPINTARTPVPGHSAQPFSTPVSAVKSTPPSPGMYAGPPPMLPQPGGIYSGAPAYRWYGWGSTTPGTNPYAPQGASPAGSSNWMAQTKATPGAFPVPVMNPFRKEPGAAPPSYGNHLQAGAEATARPLVHLPVNVHSTPVADPVITHGPTFTPPPLIMSTPAATPMDAPPVFVPSDAPPVFLPVHETAPGMTVPVPPQIIYPQPTSSSATEQPIAQSTPFRPSGADQLSASGPGVLQFSPQTQSAPESTPRPTPQPPTIPVPPPATQVAWQPAHGGNESLKFVTAAETKPPVPAAGPVIASTHPAGEVTNAVASVPSAEPQRTVLPAVATMNWAPVKTEKPFADQNFKSEVIASTPLPAPAPVQEVMPAVAVTPAPTPAVTPTVTEERSPTPAPVVPAVAAVPAPQSPPPPAPNTRPLPQPFAPPPTTEKRVELSLDTVIHNAYRGRATVIEVRHLTPKSILVKFIAATPEDAQKAADAISRLPQLKQHEVRFEARVNGR